MQIFVKLSNITYQFVKLSVNNYVKVINPYVFRNQMHQDSVTFGVYSSHDDIKVRRQTKPTGEVYIVEEKKITEDTLYVDGFFTNYKGNKYQSFRRI